MRHRPRPLWRVLVLAGVAVLGIGAAAYAGLRYFTAPQFTSTLVAAHSDKCLTAAQAQTLELQQSACNGGTGQSFAFTRTSTGAYQIRSVRNESCVDVWRGGMDNGTPFIEWSQCTRRPNQLFTLRPVPGPARSFMLVAKHSGKCADVYSGTTDDAVPVLQWDCGDPATAGNQVWRIAGAPKQDVPPPADAAPAGSTVDPTVPGPSATPTPTATPTPGPKNTTATVGNPRWGKALPPTGARFSRAYALIYGEKDKGYRPAAGECSWQVHARYWTYGPDGKVYPTWHPPRDPSGCSFGHEHGDDPRTAKLWAKTGWFAFGYTNEQLAPSSPQRQRDEDHVGHKIQLGNGVSVRSGEDGPVTMTCDALLKFHQGTHSPDAFTNNLHELNYHVRCVYKDNGGVIETRFAALLPNGHPGGITVNRECGERSYQDIGPVTPADSPDGRFSTRFIPDAVCAAEVKAGTGEIRRISEIWTTSVFARNAGQLRRFELFPFAFVANPSRFFDPDAANKLGRTIDLCYAGAKGFQCDLVRRLTEQLGRKIAWNEPRSPFNGALRLVTPGHFVVQNEGPTTLYTDVFATRFSTTPFPGAIKQYISGNHAGDRSQGDIIVPFKNFAANAADRVHAPN